MGKIRVLFEKYREIIMYLIFGVLTTLVSLLSYSLVIKLFPLSITEASAISWVIAVSFAFITNKLFVFESRSRKAATVFREVLSFFAARVISGVVEIFLPEILFKIGLSFSLFGVKGLVSKIIVNVIVIILNYIFSKLFVFRKGE
jgi:putative flippase GtrA